MRSIYETHGNAAAVRKFRDEIQALAIRLKETSQREAVGEHRVRASARLGGEIVALQNMITLLEEMDIQ